jgi:hypothetical protein
VLCPENSARARLAVPLQNEITFEPLAKLPIDKLCHSERSEESRIFRALRSFTPFRMTEKQLLQEALLAIAISDDAG